VPATAPLGHAHAHRRDRIALALLEEARTGKPFLRNPAARRLLAQARTSSKRARSVGLVLGLSLYALNRSLLRILKHGPSNCNYR
jgi:hypothetical protein